MEFSGHFLLSVHVSLKKVEKIIGGLGALEAIIFIWACRTKLAEKDDEAGF